MVSIGADARLRTWDLATAEPTGGPSRGHRSARRGQGRAGRRGTGVVVILSKDGMLHLWDLATAALLRTVPVVPAWRRRLAALTVAPPYARLPDGSRRPAFRVHRWRGRGHVRLGTAIRAAGRRPAALAGAADIGYLETAGGRVLLVCPA